MAKKLDKIANLMRHCFLMLIMLGVVFSARASGSPDVVDLSQYDPANVWHCANSRISARTENGETIWRWEITGGGEAFLWLNDDLPVHKDLPTYQRFVYDVNIAEGQIDQLWPRTTGLLPPPFDKLSCEWNRFYRTDPTKTWITYQQVFDDPTWNNSAMSAIPQSAKLDRSRVLSFVALPKGESCVIEFRHCRLVRDRVRVIKPYLTNSWPIGEMSKAGVQYRTSYLVKNVSSKPSIVKPIVRSKHQLFDVMVEPTQQTIPPGEMKSFKVLARFVPHGDSSSPLPEETAIVEFVPDGDASLAYRTETFCTAPIIDPRQVVHTPDEVAKLTADSDAAFWMNLDLAHQTEIPGAVGQRVVYAIPYQCPRCKQNSMHIGPKWLDITCDHCGYHEHHTVMADATWIASWSAIHGYGPSPASLGRAYLATHDEKYAKKAIELLTLLAKHYADLPWHNLGHPDGYDHAEPQGPGAWSNGASARWGLTPSYGTDWMFQNLAALHNMIVDSKSWTDESRRCTT